MRVLITALLLSVSTTVSQGAWADNIAGCEVVLMETIEQEGLEGSAEVASFRPAADFIASIYDDEAETIREIDGLPIRAVMCKRQSVIPSENDFPIVATGTPFMISQNFDSSETGLTTIYFKDGEFRSAYKGPDLSEKTEAEMEALLDTFNAKPHDLAEKEKAMREKTEADTDENQESDEVALEDEDETLAVEIFEETSTDEVETEDDTTSESADKDDAPAKESMEAISPEEPHDVE